MDRSEPSVNSPMPTTIMTEPIRNDSIRPVPTGTRNRHSSATIRVMGRTEAIASRIFSVIILSFGNFIPLTQ